MRQDSLEFTQLPLVEVALKRVPVAPLPVNLPFILGLRDKLSGRFDRILDLDMLEQPPGVGPSIAYSIQGASGCRLIDSESGIAVSLQPNVVIVRWSARVGKNYPRFSSLQEAMNSVIVAIEAVGVQRFEPALVNLAYANRVEASAAIGTDRPDPWPLSSEWTPPGLLSDVQSIGMDSSFRGKDGIDLRVVIQHRSDPPESPPWYLLMTLAGKLIEPSASVENEENAIHQALIEWFPRLLSVEAKQAYGLQI